MSLIVPISENKIVLVQPQKTIEISNQVTITRIVDLPHERKVFVFTEELGKIDLPSLSNQNYDSPYEWTNADLLAAVQQYINGLEIISIN